MNRPGRPRLTLLQGGHVVEMPSAEDVVLKEPPCVMHDCPRPGEVEQVLHIGGKDVPLRVCEVHARQAQQTIA